MALAAKRRRLSQADSFGSGPHPQESASVPTAKEAEGEKVGPPAKKRRGRPPKVQRVWSPSGGVCGGL